MNSEHVTDSVILIHAHLTSQVRKDFCHDFIRQFKSFGYDVILTTHAPVDRDTQDLADYVVYDKDNLLLKNPEYRGYINFYTAGFDIMSREFVKQNTILAVLRLLLAGTAYAKLLKKKVIHIFDYDGYLENDIELQNNYDKIKNGSQGVLYERVKEQINCNDGRGGIYNRHWQIMTLIMSLDVDFLYNRLTKYTNEHLEEQMVYWGIQCGEELLAYVLGVSFLNKDEGDHVANIEIKNLRDDTYDGEEYEVGARPLNPDLQKCGFKYSQVYLEEDYPWICLAYFNDKWKFFCMRPKRDEIEESELKIRVISNHHNVEIDAILPAWIWRTLTFDEHELQNLKIYVDDNLFREYDLTDSETKPYLIKCNRWYDK